MTLTKLRPINNHALVEPVKKEEKKTAAGIIIPDVNSKASRNRLESATVKLVGEVDEESKLPVINPGEVVYYRPGVGTEILIEDKIYLVIPIAQLALVLEP